MNSNIVFEQSAIADNYYDLDVGVVPLTEAIIELLSVRDGYESFQSQSHRVSILQPGVELVFENNSYIPPVGTTVELKFDH